MGVLVLMRALSLQVLPTCTLLPQDLPSGSALNVSGTCDFAGTERHYNLTVFTTLIYTPCLPWTMIRGTVYDPGSTRTAQATGIPLRLGKRHDSEILNLLSRDVEKGSIFATTDDNHCPA